MPGISSRLNGQKGGRPVGSENETTKIQRAMKTRWLQGVHEKADELLRAQMDLALGCYEKIETPDGEVRAYKRNPDRRAIEWLLEQVWGKAPQATLLDEREVCEENAPMTEELQVSIAQAIHFALPANRRTASGQ